MLNIKGGLTAGKVAHWLIILAALAKEWGSVPSTYMATHMNLYLLFQQSGAFSDHLGLMHTHAAAVHLYTLSHTHAYKIK